MLLALIPLVIFVIGVLLWYFINPPFNSTPVARILIAGLDEPPKFHRAGPRRTDSLILCAMHMDGSGTTLISIPRDARVRLPHHRGYGKINAAYAEGKMPLLKETLAQPAVIGADFPYHLVIDSRTVREAVDALGGITVNVPLNMDYDDSWGNLHIHLKAGKQRLNGEQAVGYLRWRKNKHGQSSTDFFRSDRQRALLAAIMQQARTPQGIRNLPATFAAFKRYSYTNLSLKQFIALGLAFKNVRSEAVPGNTATIGGVSYVVCDWDKGKAIWHNAIK